jgi:alkylation response protein AidB-like acyl-CoA dehydrogenase
MSEFAGTPAQPATMTMQAPTAPTLQAAFAGTARWRCWPTTELADDVLDNCVQLHGGNGYMWEYPIARAWADARVHRIYAGTNEIMKYIVGRAL